MSILSMAVIFYSCSKGSNGTATPSNPVPGSPVSLTAAIATGNAINLNWVDSSSNETGFHVERKTGSGAYSVIATVGPNITTYLDNSTSANTTYTYRVNSFNAAGNSVNYTNEVTINSTLGIDSLVVSLSTNTVENNGWDMVTITVKDKFTGTDVTANSSLFLNSGPYPSPIASAIFYPYANGNYTVSATQGSLVSNQAPLSVVTPGASAFTHKIMVEDYTSVFCGYCPREFSMLDNYTSTQPRCAWVCVHGLGLGADPLAYQYDNNMEATFTAVTGYPTSIIDRKNAAWNEDTAALTTEINKWTGLGLAITSSVNGSTITGTAQVKYNITTNKPLKIVIAIVESGSLQSQDNYYSPTGGQTPYLYGGKDPIPNFNEKFALRTTSTNLYGDTIPVSSTFKGNVYSIPFTFNLTNINGNGTNYTMVPANCRIVAYVIDGATGSPKGALNVQYAAVGATQAFD